MINKLIFASQNPGKIREVKNIFEGSNIELISLNDFERYSDNS